MKSKYREINENLFEILHDRLEKAGLPLAFEFENRNLIEWGRWPPYPRFGDKDYLKYKNKKYLIYEEKGKFYAEINVIAEHESYIHYLENTNPEWEALYKLNELIIERHKKKVEIYSQKKVREQNHPLKRILRLFQKITASGRNR